MAVALAEGAATSARVTMPLYLFSGTAAERAEALAKFERIDDVIMGGVSRSKLADGNGCASWRGLVRTEGGGFCGQRTLPFDAPLNLTGADGVYIACRLASDAEADRRVWKLSLRTDEGRGEVVYQAPFNPPVGATAVPVYVPFSKFVLVRGPIAVPGAPKISRTSAVYQLGFTVSKFVISDTMTPLENFRNGTFQLDIAELGAYADAPQSQWLDSSGRTASAPATLSDSQARRRRPLVEGLLSPVFRALFSEQKRRRQRAANLLIKRGASRLDLVRMGWSFKRRLRGQRILNSVLQTVGEVSSAAFGGALLLLCRALVFPLVGRQMRRRRRKEMERLKAPAAAASEGP